MTDQPQPSPPQQKSALEGSRQTIKILIAFLVIGGALWVMRRDGGGGASTLARIADGDSRSSPAPSGPPHSAPPFVAELQGLCRAYDAAPNEIKKSEIFRYAKQQIEGQRAFTGRGKLDQISTNQGGSELRLVIETRTNGSKQLFATESVFAPIKSGSAVYRAAANMREGECVVWSASRFESASLVERSQVCDLDFFARFTALKTCAEADAPPKPAPKKKAK